MAKSSRSKWKKLHRRQRAQAELHNTVKRVSRLNKKLKLTAKGGISLVPPQDPEKRFHFTNPEKNLRVPDPRREYNNDYRGNRVVIDFSKNLKLSPPKTNFYGKSDIHAPHIMTVNYDVIDADAPTAGHAMTKADLERAERKAREAANAANEEGVAQVSSFPVDAEEAEDGPEEFVFGLDDAAPRKVLKLGKKSKTAVQREKALENEEEDYEGYKISSMSESHQGRSGTISTGGTSKVKRMSGMSGSAASRITSSGSGSSKKKTKK